MDEEKPADNNDQAYLNLGTNGAVETTESPVDIDPVHLNQGTNRTIQTTDDSYPYDIVDTPMGNLLSDHSTKHPMDEESDLDIATDPGAKQARVDNAVGYDVIDTPMITSPINGMSEDQKTEEHKSTSDCTVSSGRLDFIDNKDEDLSNQNFDATDSGPASAVSTEVSNEDGPFGKHMNHKSKETPSPVPACSFTDSSHSIRDDLSDRYPMKTTPRGYFLIINNRDFLPYSEMHNYPRKGTDIDAAAMVSLFQELRYDISEHHNLTVKQMREECRRASSMDYHKYSAFVCCILSHGQEGILYGTDKTIQIKEITGYFRGRNLAGKPKVFFFQACQGSDYMDGVQTDSVDGLPDSVYGNDISLPTESDFIYAYSTVPGYYSWRNSAKGSWFIQGIVKVFRQYAHKMDVIRMLTRVNQMVSTQKSATGQWQSHDKRQISSIITQLRYELYLSPPNGPLKENRPAF